MVVKKVPIFVLRRVKNQTVSNCVKQLVLINEEISGYKGM